MDRIIEKLDRGWWIVSHEQKLWLPDGELPYGEAVISILSASALHIGEWQGDPVWMVRQDRRMRWDRCVRCWIRILAFSSWRDAGSSWRVLPLA
jgi:NADH pyrophosphatase NudC (nudix superfamily)